MVDDDDSPQRRVLGFMRLLRSADGNSPGMEDVIGERKRDDESLRSAAYVCELARGFFDLMDVRPRTKPLQVQVHRSKLRQALTISKAHLHAKTYGTNEPSANARASRK